MKTKKQIMARAEELQKLERTAGRAISRLLVAYEYESLAVRQVIAEVFRSASEAVLNEFHDSDKSSDLSRIYRILCAI